MKKLISSLFLFIIIMLPLGVQALSVDENNLTIEKGNNKTIDIYANVEEETSEIDFTLVYSTYDIPAYFTVASGLTDGNPDGITHKIIFSEPVTGNVKLGSIKINVVNNPGETTGTINIHSGIATTTTGEKNNLNAQIINVNVGMQTTTTEENSNNNDNNNNENDNNDTDIKETKESSMLLEKIESDIVKIELKEDVYEYTVNIKKDIEELDLKPITKDEKYKVDITTQKISELQDNQIIITVKDGDNTEEYKIKVNILEVDKVEIDDEVFESTYKYKGKWITLIVILSIILLVGLGLNKKKVG